MDSTDDTTYKLRDVPATMAVAVVVAAAATTVKALVATVVVAAAAAEVEVTYAATPSPAPTTSRAPPNASAIHLREDLMLDTVGISLSETKRSGLLITDT